MKTLYILLTRVPTAASRVIRLATGDAYTHVALAWDPALSTLCSFARRYWRFPIPAGLVQEDVRAGNYIRHAHPVPCWRFPSLTGSTTPSAAERRPCWRKGAVTATIMPA